MYDEIDLLPLSGLQHLAFCERQWALIHIEQQWVENRLTAEGRVLHERADTPSRESRGDVRIVRGLSIQSHELGVVGRADVVEFHRTDDADAASTDCTRKAVGIHLLNATGLWRPFPVEYKRGRPKPFQADRVQLCAQALCLEVMLGVSVPAGALFYGKTRRRIDVTLDDPLRKETKRLAARMHELFRSGVTPRAIYDRRRCDRCSLYDCCLPKTTGSPPNVAAYLTALSKEALDKE